MYDGEIVAEWNIDGLIEYQLLQVLEIMSMCFNAYIAKKAPPTSATNNPIIGFAGQLKNWWFNYLIQIERDEIVKAVNNKGENYSFSTLFYIVIKHFIGIPIDVIDRPFEILMNLNCPKFHDFRWYNSMKTVINLTGKKDFYLDFLNFLQRESKMLSKEIIMITLFLIINSLMNNLPQVVLKLFMLII